MGSRGTRRKPKPLWEACESDGVSGKATKAGEVEVLVEERVSVIDGDGEDVRGWRRWWQWRLLLASPVTDSD